MSSPGEGDISLSDEGRPGRIVPRVPSSSSPLASLVQTTQVLGQAWSSWKTEVLTKETSVSSGVSSQPPALTNSSWRLWWWWWTFWP